MLTVLIVSYFIPLLRGQKKTLQDVRIQKLRIWKCVLQKMKEDFYLFTIKDEGSTSLIRKFPFTLYVNMYKSSYVHVRNRTISHFCEYFCVSDFRQRKKTRSNLQTRRPHFCAHCLQNQKFCKNRKTFRKKLDLSEEKISLNTVILSFFQ